MSRMWLIRLSTTAYIVLFLAFAGISALRLYTRFSTTPTTTRLLGLVGFHLLVLIVLGIFLAVILSVIFGSLLFGVIRFLAVGLFVILPITLLLFAVVLWTADSSGTHLLAYRAVPGFMLICAGLLVATYIYAHFIEPYRLETTFYQIRSAKLAGLAKPLRIVLLADIQTDRITDYEISVFRRSLELQPDLILLAGDYLQSRSLESYCRQVGMLRQTLTEMNFLAPLGVFAVPGDCERYNGNGCFDGTKVRWLIDRTAIINTGNISISLTGLSLFSGKSSGTLTSKLPQTLNPSRFNIILSHQPNFVLDLPSGHSVDLCLCGHTHGGQICLPFIGALATACRVPTSQASGLHQINGTSLCISRGIGTELGWSPRLRFLCRPQLVVLDLLAE